MMEILRPLGFIVLTAPDGPAALELVREIRPDLFLLDIEMPGLDGWALARALRAEGHKGAIVMLSATIGERQTSREGEGADVQAALAKPFDLGQLFLRLEALLGLEWITAEDMPAVTVLAPPTPIVLPAPGDVAQLLEFGRIGYKRGIDAKLGELAADPILVPFVAKLRSRSENFDMAGYCAILEAIDRE